MRWVAGSMPTTKPNYSTAHSRVEFKRAADSAHYHTRRKVLTMATSLKHSWSLLDGAPQAPVGAEGTPAALAAEQGGAMCARSSHSVSVVGDTMYCLGGELVARTPINSTLWARPLPSGEWAPVAAANDGPSARIAHAQAVVGGTHLYVFGGRASLTMEEAPLNDLWRFDLEARAWEQVHAGGEASDALPCPRSFHKAAAVGGDLFVFGGCGASGRLADVWRFSVSDSAWALVKDAAADGVMPGRGGAGFVPSLDGASLFVVGGFAGEETNNVHRLDLASGTWSTVHENGNALLVPFSVSCAAPLTALGALAFFGGEVGASQKGHEGAGMFGAHVLLLDGITGQFLRSDEAPPAADGGDAPQPRARGWASADAWGGDKLVVFGGLTGDDSAPLRLADTWALTVAAE